MPIEETHDASFLTKNSDNQAGEEPIIEASRFSSWNRLVRVTLFVLRFLSFIFRKEGKSHHFLEARRKELLPITRKGPFKAEDVEMAQHLIRLDQIAHGDEFYQLYTIIDDDGILRLKTRLERSEQTFGFAHPIILSHRSTLTDLIILHCHQKRHHIGVDGTLTEFLSTYWTTHARRTVKQALKKCLHCRRMTSYPFALPVMPPLPPERVRRQVPFQSIGIDFFGPTTTNLHGEKHKVWIIIITCMATRAVYLEAMLNTTASAVINVLRRFISRRGKPDLIWSDNATTFQPAEKTLEVLTDNGPAKTGDFLAANHIRWRFIPQISPWAGGFYERLVKLCKDCFKRTLGRRILGYDDLNTFVAEVECTLNHRPITAVSDAADGPLPLRPINFLHPEIQINWETTTKELEDDPTLSSTHEQLASRIQALRGANDVFWEKCHSEYLPLLRERAGWNHKGPRLQDHTEPKEGMIVLVAEDYTPRNQWPMGRISEVHGHPGAIRSVTVEIPVRSTTKKARTNALPRKSVLIRPINRIFPLEAGTELAETPPNAKNDEPPEAPRPPSQDPPEGRQIITRRRAKLMGGLPAITLLCFLVTITSLHAYPVGQCKECGMKCSLRGIQVTLPPEIQKVELCCAENCIVREDTRKLNYELPVEVLMNDYKCEGQFWTDSHHRFSAETTCPATDACDLLDCHICLAQLANPTCQPTTVALLIGSISVSLLCFLLLLCLLLSYCCSSIKSMAWVVSVLFTPCLTFITKKKRRTQHFEEQEDPLIYQSRRRHRFKGKASKEWMLKRLGKAATTALALLPTVRGAAEPVVTMAHSRNCLRTTNSMTCKLQSTATLTLLPAGQTNTVLMQTEDGQLLGYLHVVLKSLSLECQGYTKAWLRSYDIASISNKRCPAAGSCTEEFCSQVHTNTPVEELKKNNVDRLPGYNFCLNSPSYWQDRCLFSSQRFGACLFYRWYAKPRSNTTYEIISCNSWIFGINVRLQLETNDGNSTTRTTTLHPGRVFKWKEISIHPPSIHGSHPSSDAITRLRLPLRRRKCSHHQRPTSERPTLLGCQEHRSLQLQYCTRCLRCLHP